MISAAEHSMRRLALLAAMPNDSVYFCFAAQQKIRSNDSPYPYRQNSDFWYLTGFPEENACLVLQKKASQQTTTLYCHDRDPAKEQWDGARMGVAAAKEHTAVDVSKPIELLNAETPMLLDCTDVYIGWDQKEKGMWLWDTITQKQAAQRNPYQPQNLRDIRPILHQQRLIKSAAELDCMRKAQQLSISAHQAVLAQLTNAYEAGSSIGERQLAATFAYQLASSGLTEAYHSIVANGSNAGILHYIANNQPCCAGDLLLIDAGGEFQTYAADITRTYPVNGIFTAEQHAVYALVLDVQQAAIQAVGVGQTWENLHALVVLQITEGLHALQLLSGSVSDSIEQELYREFFMHGTGHWLGIDVHDVGARDIPFATGMVLTIEPGIYISPDNPKVPQAYRGIGIRIEDNILVTAAGRENLTAGLDKSLRGIQFGKKL